MAVRGYRRIYGELPGSARPPRTHPVAVHLIEVGRPVTAAAEHRLATREGHVRNW
jgi:hypothetical protein